MTRDHASSALATAFLATLALGLAAGLAVGLWNGLPYFRLSHDVRLDHDLRALYGPGGSVGILFGVVGTALMVAMNLYTLRKWLVGATWLGNPVHWLRFHILCGVTGPLFILLHTAFHLPRGLIAVGFWCMVLVALSGGFGRYVYGWFPRVQGGRALAWNEANEALLDLRGELVAATATAHGEGVGRAVRLARDLDMEARTVGDLWRLQREMGARRRQMRGLLAEAALPADAERRALEMLDSQLRLKGGLESMRVVGRMFRYWHLFHRPLAGAMYTIVALHIVFAVLFGGALKPLMEWL